MEGKGDSDGFRRIEYGHHKETPMDSYGSNEAVWRENETLMDSHRWKGDIERQDENEKETAMDSNLLKRTRQQGGWKRRDRRIQTDWADM